MNDRDLRPIVWVGDSKKQLLKMPKEVRQIIGFQLLAVQKGDKPRLAKPLRHVGNGVWEIRSRYQTDTFRAVYAVQIGQAIYILHAFQKKSKSGIRTPKQDIDLIKQRYGTAVALAKTEPHE